MPALQLSSRDRSGYPSLPKMHLPIVPLMSLISLQCYLARAVAITFQPSFGYSIPNAFSQEERNSYVCNYSYKPCFNSPNKYNLRSYTMLH